ncbi:MAG: beta-lactamase family protein, partial [Pontibacter sp.]|nr:beta-lactamase family protein [Pontibacter sp.]
PFSSSQSVEVNYEPYNWQTSTPANVGYSDAAVKQYLHDIEGWERLRGLIVIKDGKVVVEKYQGGATRYSAFNVHSVTKSISSALTGIAIRKGYLPSDQESVLPYFPEYGRNLPTQRPKSPLTVAHLLSMRGGFKGWDGAQNVEQALVSEGISEDKVGQEFKYYTGSHMVLSALLNKATHTPTRDFAQEELFKPLGIHCAFWRKVDGYYAGGDETYFTARDLARLGYLHLNKGNVDGVQLLDSAWVSKSFTNYTRESKAFRTLGCYQEVGYGYSWWLLNFNNQVIYTARGKGGQHVLVIPEQNVVAVILQEWNRQKDFEKENAYLCQLLSILTTNERQLAGKGTD